MVTHVTNYGRSGLYDWLVQRVTAVVLLAFFVYLAGFLISHPNLNYHQWKALFDSTCMQVFTTMAILSLVLHSWIGLWGVSTDYMTTRLMGKKGTAVRLLFQATYSIILFYYLVWGLKILWG